MREHGVFLVMAALACAAAAADEGPLVTLAQGKLRGKVLKTFSEKNMFAFIGIPYGKPPVKELRFKVRYILSRKKFSFENLC
jgi:Carboxylesterase family